MQSPASKHIAPSDRICGFDTRAIETAASESAATTFRKNMIVVGFGGPLNECSERMREYANVDVKRTARRAFLYF